MTLDKAKEISEKIKSFAYPILIGVVAFFMIQFYQQNEYHNQHQEDTLQDIKITLEGLRYKLEYLDKDQRRLEDRVKAVETRKK